jgi:hypothetical protein
MFICEHGITVKNFKFPKDKNGKFLPAEYLLEPIESALLFYFIKKDKAMQKRVSKMILSNDIKDINSLVDEIKSEVFSKNSVKIAVKDRIYLDKETVERAVIKEFSYLEKEFTASFDGEIYRGVIDISNIDIGQLSLEKFSLALLGFSQALANYEHKMLKGSSLEEDIAYLQNKIANEWNSSIRIGEWNSSSLRGYFLFFWRVKEIREHLLKRLDFDILPKDTYFIKKRREFLGWSEFNYEYIS